MKVYVKLICSLGVSCFLVSLDISSSMSSHKRRLKGNCPSVVLCSLSFFLSFVALACGQIQDVVTVIFMMLTKTERYGKGEGMNCLKNERGNVVQYGFVSLVVDNNNKINQYHKNFQIKMASVIVSHR